jgi:hypothetical protein
MKEKIEEAEKNAKSHEVYLSDLKQEYEEYKLIYENYKEECQNISD